MDKVERTAMDERAVEAVAEELRERTAFRYAADCKCGACQLVPRKLIDEILPHLYRLAAYEAAKPAPMSTSGEMVERLIKLAEYNGAGANSVIRDALREAASRLESLEALFAEQAGELERVKGERDGLRKSLDTAMASRLEYRHLWEVAEAALAKAGG